MNRTLARYAVALCAALTLVAASETSSYAKSPGMTELTKAGQLGLGFNGSFNFTWLSNDTLEGDTANNSTLFLLLAPELGYFFSDRAQITFSAGGLVRRLARTDSSSNTSTDLVLGVNAKYHVPLTEVFSFIPGVGLGGYFGGASRPIQVTAEDGTITTADESTSTFGLDLSGQLAFGYLVGDRTSLITGLKFDYLFGQENISSLDNSLTIQTFNTSLNIGVFYFF
jgi:hypothetical protein